MSVYNPIRGLTARTIFANLSSTLEAGFKKGETLRVGKVNYTPAALAAIFAKAEGPYLDVENARAKVTNAVRDRDAALAQPYTLAQKVVAALDSYCDGDPEKLLAFKIPPLKPKHALTSTDFAARAEKARETRSMRGTLGKRQKSKIKAQGNVSVTTVLSASEPASPSGVSASAATNASSAASASNTVAPGAASALNGVQH